VKQAVVQVFDDHLADTTPRRGAYRVTKYTSLEHTDLLASADQLGIQAVAEVIEAGADVPLVVAIEHSANGYDWKPKSPTAEIAGTIPAGAGTATLVGGERWPARPSQRFVRLRIDAGDGDRPFAITVRVLVSVRNRAVPAPRRSPADATVPRVPFPTTASLFGVRNEVLREIHDLVLSSQHLDPPARHAHILRNLSLGSANEVTRLVGRLRALDAGSKEILIAMARGLIRLLSLPERGRAAGTGVVEEG
jgi:hypothetical protein